MAINSNIAELIIRTKDEVSKNASKIDASLTRIARNAGNVMAAFGVGIGFAGIASVVKSATAAYSEQEDAIARLRASLISTGQESQGYLNLLQQQASALQSVTTLGDEAILSLQQQLIAFGASSDKIEELTKATLDLAAGMRIDLQTAGLLMGKAIAGQFSTLSRYGILVDENASKSEKLAQALDQINKRFGGQAQAQAETFAGRIKQLSNAFGDLLENIGRIIVEDKKAGFLQTLKSIIEALKRFTSEERSLERELETLVKRRESLEKSAAGIFRTPDPRELTRVEERIAQIQKRLIELREVEKPAPKVAPSPPDEEREKKVKSFTESLNKQIEALALQETELSLGQRAVLEYKIALIEAEAAELGLTNTLKAKLEAFRALTFAIPELKKSQEEIDELTKRWDIDLQEVGRGIQETWDLILKPTMEKMEEEGKRVTESLRTAQEKYNDELKRLGELLDAGAISSETFFRGLKAAQEDLTNATKKTDDAARQLGLTFTSAFEDAILEGKKFQDVLAGIFKDLARLAIRKSVTEPAAKVLSPIFGSIFSGIGSFVKRFFGFQTGPGEFKQVPGPPGRAVPAIVHGGEMIGRPGPMISITNHIDARFAQRGFAKDLARELRATEERAVTRAIHEVRERKLRGGNFSNAFER